MTETPESDEVAGHQWRLAQAQRLLRFCDEQGVDPKGLLIGSVTIDLDPICDVGGKIVPEPVDFIAVGKGMSG